MCMEARRGRTQGELSARRLGEGDWREIRIGKDARRLPMAPAQTCVSTSRYRPHATQALKTIGEYRHAAGIDARASYGHGGTPGTDVGREE